MRFSIYLTVVFLACPLSQGEQPAPASAAGPSSDASGLRAPLLRRLMLRKFDADNDGKLSGSERATLKEKAAARRAKHPKTTRQSGGGDRIQGNWRKHILRKFDADKDGTLSEPERTIARDAFREFLSADPAN